MSDEVDKAPQQRTGPFPFETPRIPKRDGLRADPSPPYEPISTRKVQSLLIEIARDNQLSADSFHTKEASPLMDMFPVNSYVLLKPPDGSREKLQMPKAGPYIVVGVSGDKYSIQDLLTHKTTDTHVSNLCEFRYDSSSGLEPIEVAARNADEFFIDRIYGHRDTTTKRLNMEFLVSWKGYSQKDDTWEPYKAVCKIQAFVHYCYANKLTSLVSKTLRG